MPLRIVLDTNVLVSALISPGSSRSFVLQLIFKNIEIMISDYIISEMEEVLARYKFRDKKIYKSLWQKIKSNSIIIEVGFILSSGTYLRDPKDQPILQTAEKGKAEFIITGDEDLLVLKQWRRIKIVRMRDLSKLYSRHSIG